MDMIRSIRNALVPIHPDGHKFVAAFLLGAIVVGLLWEPLFWIGLILTLWCAYFFRDPERVSPQDGELAVSPADGRISLVGRAVAPPELLLGAMPLQRVSIFMNVFDCHVNRAPVRGRVERVVHRDGEFLNAELDKASEVNERVSLTIDSPLGPVGVVQIAGAVARRIVPFVREGDHLEAGERFGLIRFGSRLDVYLPETLEPCVAEGQRAVAGETVLARRPSGDGPLLFRRD